MFKMVALYKKPSDVSEFEKHYFEVHTKLVQKIPGLLRSDVSRIKGMPGQESKYYLMCEMYFENMGSLNSGMASAEGKEAGKDLMGFAKDYVTLMFAEGLE